MTLLSTQTETKKQPQLSRDDWIERALEVLVEDGIHAVQITTLAKKLGVTRGSFYWHIESREDLLDALIAEWRARNTDIMVDTLSKSPDFETGILDLFFVWADHKQFDPMLDHAIRNWSRSSVNVEALVSEEDASRVQTISGFYEAHGYEPTEAFIRARVIYFTQVSYYALNITEPMEKRMSYLSAYFRSFTGREISDAASAEFKARLVIKKMKVDQ